MNDKFYEQLEYYLDNKLSANEFIHNFKLLDRERFVENSNNLLNNIDIRLKKLFDVLKTEIEELTDLVYAGCYNSLENTNADFKNYIIVFQHCNDSYFKANISLGSFASCGSGKNIKYIRYDNENDKLKFGFETASCHYTGGQLNINNENILLDSLTKIIYFCYDDKKQRQIFLDNYKKISNKELYSKLNYYDE